MALGLKPLADTPAHLLEFPESDGQPMGETGIHVNQILALYAALRLFFRFVQDVYVGANMFMYYEPTDPRQNFCPDVFAAFGVRPGERRTWKTWEEGKVPDIIIEITSKSTRREDTREKRALYEDLGVREYFLFDPLHEYLTPRLQGHRLVAGRFEPLSGDVLTSEVLGLELRVKDDDRLHFFDPKRGMWLLINEELSDYADEVAARAEAERARAEAAVTHAETERARAEAAVTHAETEHARAEAAEAELARLRDEIARLKGE
jgi:Uma2 family endonuclease